MRDTWRKSKIFGGLSKSFRESPPFEIVREEFRQVTRIVRVVVVDVAEEKVHLLSHVDLCQFAAAHEGVDDGGILSCGNYVAAENMTVIGLAAGNLQGASSESTPLPEQHQCR